MGKKHLEAVREWARTHPPPPGTADEFDKATYRAEVHRAGITVDDLMLAAGEILRAAQSAPDPMGRKCFVCEHPVSAHGQEGECECCRKGVTLIPKGVSVMQKAIEERR